MADAYASPGRLRSGHGCLWGCLVAALIAAGLVFVAISYSSWWLTSGYQGGKTLHLVVDTLNSDRIARSVLGDNIRIVDLQSSTFASDTISGSREAYIVRVQGSRAAGTLAVTVDTMSGKSRITSMLLTGPDGGTYDLTVSRP
jgi:hypothetical protein